MALSLLVTCVSSGDAAYIKVESADLRVRGRGCSLWRCYPVTNYFEEAYP